MTKKRFPSFAQWKQLFKVVKGKERTLLLSCAGLALVSLLYIGISFYLSHTKAVAAYGGTFTEGVVGQPRFINPVYGETDDVDRGIIDLVYSGLFTYDSNGKLTPDLVQDYQVSPDGKTYTFQLKPNLYWQDGQKLTADDVIFTIQTIQNSDYKSPLRANWLNVAAIKLSDSSFSLSLASPYNAFLENCTLKIIPAHIWKNIPATDFALSSYNLQPVGSGPYRVQQINQNSSGLITNIQLAANTRYYGKLPYISNFDFDFFQDSSNLLTAANQKTVNAFALDDLNDTQTEAQKQVNQGWDPSAKFSSYSFTMPRYFAVFFNMASPHIFADGSVSQALSYAVNKTQLVQNLSSQSGEAVTQIDSPILPTYYGFTDPTVTYPYNVTKANSLLDTAGYKQTSSGLRVKTSNKKPAFQFTTYLKIGSTGTAVSELQSCLASLDPTFKAALQGDKSGTYGTGTGQAVTEFQQKYLPAEKPTGETGTGTRTELNQLCFANQNSTNSLQFTLTTVNDPQLVQVANELKTAWAAIGVSVLVKPVELSQLQSIIKNRDYDALLYGQALGSEPDLYPFWDSTQIQDPGLNLSAYQDKNADQLLVSARQDTDPTVEASDYEKLQNTILTDAPALFLYNPAYVYWVSNNVQGVGTTNIVDPAKRFENVTNWFIKTKRIWN
jgi:ABC-type transport system substrate-binding protein